MPRHPPFRPAHQSRSSPPSHPPPSPSLRVTPVLQALLEGRTPADGPQYFEQLCRAASRAELEAMAAALEQFRRATPNFYHRVRALFFLEAIHRYFLPPHYAADNAGSIPFEGHQHALERRFEEAIDTFLRHQREHGASDALSSALAAAYHGLEFKTLATQVQKTVRTVRGNQWMFRTGHPLDYPLRLRSEMLPRGGDAAFAGDGLSLRILQVHFPHAFHALRGALNGALQKGGGDPGENGRAHQPSGRNAHEAVSGRVRIGDASVFVQDDGFKGGV